MGVTKYSPVIKNERLAEALTCADRRWPVLPLHGIKDGRCTCGNPECNNQGKHPRTKHGVKDATTDKNVIRQWGEKWPDANFGIATGKATGLVVLDVDPRHGGDESLQNVREKYGEIPDTAETITGGGGKHLLFRHPGNGTVIRNAANFKGFEGLDLKSDGGYIAAPSSSHISGGTYRWELSSHPDEVSLAPTPAWILSPVSDKTDKPDTDGTDRPDGTGRSESMCRWATEALEGVPEGERDATCFRLAARYKTKGLDLEETLFHLKRWAKDCEPEFPAHEVEKCVKSAYTQRISENEPEPDTMLIWAKDMELLEGEEIESLWGDVFFPESIHLFSGESGAGKTTFLYNLAIEGAKGKSLLDIPFPHPFRTLYLDLESPSRLRAHKLNLIAGNERPEELAFFTLTNIAWELDRLIAIVQEHGFDLVIVDTINEAFQTQKEDDNAEANRQMKMVRKLVRQTGAAVILVHHMGKKHQEKGVYKSRGATARAAASDVVINFEGVDGEVARLSIGKNRWYGDKSELLLRKIGDDRFEPTEQLVTTTAPKGSIAENAILQMLTNGPAERKDIIAKAEEYGITKSTVERSLTHLVKMGRVTKLDRGFYGLENCS